MITIKRKSTRPRATVLDIKSTPPPEPAVSFGDIDPDFDRRRRNLERTRRDAAVVEAEAMGTAMLDELSRDETQDPSEIRSRGEAVLDAFMSDQLASVRDRALETGMRFKLDRLRNRLSAQLAEIEEAARNMAIARSSCIPHNGCSTQLRTRPSGSDSWSRWTM